MNFSIKNFKSFYNVIKPIKNDNRTKYNINIKTKKDYVKDDIIKSISFEKPIPIIDALKLFVESPDILNGFSQLKDYSPLKDIQKLINEVNTSDKLKNIKTNNLIGCGYSSYVFDIGNDKVLKFTYGDHFKGRKPLFFDLPIQESGKITKDGRHYYYIEEKVSQDNITDYDIEMIEAQAGLFDYMLIDCHSKRQFGRTKEGHLRLIDPECAEKKPNIWYQNFKQRILDRICNRADDYLKVLLGW